MGPKNISSLVPDIEALFDGHSFNEVNLSRFSSTIEEVIRTRFREYGQERYSRLRLSNVGKPLRQIYLELRTNLVPEPLSVPTKTKFLFGDFCEALMIALAIEAGHNVTDLQKQVEIDDIVGHIDCLIDDVLIDVKSASTFSFQKFKDGSIRNDDPFGYQAQLAGYSTALGLIDAGFLAFDKSLGHITLCFFPKEELSKFNIVEHIRKVKDALTKVEWPPCCCNPVPEGKSGNEKLPAQGAYCGWKKHCYPDLRTFLYSSGPMFLTTVKREPAVFEAQYGK